jgi:hypothetical protein
VELAREDRGVLRRLAARIELESPPSELVAATRQAIADATDFDERDANRNFAYDYEAYAEVRRNLKRLINLGELRFAMELSLEFPLLFFSRLPEGHCEARPQPHPSNARGHPEVAKSDADLSYHALTKAKRGHESK